MPRNTAPALNLNGYNDLPAGKIAAVVTFLEMRSPPRPTTGNADGWSLQRIDHELDRYRALFRRVGEPWLWFSRAVMPESELRATLSNPKVEAYALRDRTGDIGLLELDFRMEAECELVYFGLVPEAVGQGAGRFLMSGAIRLAYAKPIRRFFVHTCSLDHPRALEFYIRSGFTPYKRSVEIADDPRLKGYLPLDAAPQVPVIGNDLKTARRAPARRRLVRSKVV